MFGHLGGLTGREGTGQGWSGRQWSPWDPGNKIADGSRPPTTNPMGRSATSVGGHGAVVSCVGAGTYTSGGFQDGMAEWIGS